MRNQSLIVLIAMLFLAGCDSGTETIQYQDIGEIRWSPDGNSLYGFIQSYAYTANSSHPDVGIYDFAKFGADGFVIQKYANSVKSRPYDPVTGEGEYYNPAVYLSSDGSTLVAQLENDLYRFHPAANSLEKLVTQFHLIVASPDLHYAVGTGSPSTQPLKTIDIYDLTSTPVRRMARLQYVPSSLSTGIWLGNQTFGITCIDSIGTHISIYSVFDTTGIPVRVIAGAQTPFHNTVYNAANNELYFLNRSGKTTDYFVDKINLTSLVRSTVLNFQVNNFDLTGDGQVIIYSLNDSIKSRNLQSLREQTLATDIFRYVVLSPAEDKIAYVAGGLDFNKVRVIPFTRP